MDEKQEFEVLSAEVALTAQERGTIDVQIATAKKYPRSLKEFKDMAIELACIDEETAQSMFYTLPARGQGNKKIEGPSVRMAEVVYYAWKNLRAETDIQSIDDSFVTAVATVHDIERNTAVRFRVKRRITTKDGRRYSDDMIGVTCNAAMSIAFREAMFKAVPRAFVKQLYEKAKATAVGSLETLGARRAKAIEWFKSQGVDEKVIYKKLGRKSIEEVTLDDLADLTGLRSAIREGDISIAEAFAEEESAASASTLAETLKKKKAPEAPKGADLEKGGVHPVVKDPFAPSIEPTLQTEIK